MNTRQGNSRGHTSNIVGSGSLIAAMFRSSVVRTCCSCLCPKGPHVSDGEILGKRCEEEILAISSPFLSGRRSAATTGPAFVLVGHPTATDPLPSKTPELIIQQSQQDALALAGSSHKDVAKPTKPDLSRCPFAHGSVGVGPYPGYVHGKHPAVCANGCTPDPLLGKHGHVNEGPLETLLREALEYQELYHREMASPDDVKSARIQQVLTEIKQMGMYSHTFEELEHGARVAWRNAPKCSNRKFWNELNLLDNRTVDTEQGMFEACLNMLEKTSMELVTSTNVCLFRPQTPGTHDGPRIWNSQLIRFACYHGQDDQLVGDPSELAFTDMLQKDFGWKPPEHPTAWDPLPLLLQTHPDKLPVLFTIPKHYIIKVPITHPEMPWFRDLGIQWYAVPAVSNMEVSIGGLLYTAAPFNGWYADTEITRNLTEERRYNLLPAVAAGMQLEISSDNNMWKDRAMAEVVRAVLHSFQEAGLAMSNHHTLMSQFHVWYHKELASRGYCPGNWKWIITPLTPVLSRCYLGLSKMTEYTLKPSYWAAPGWREYRKRLVKLGVLRQAVPATNVLCNPYAMRMVGWCMRRLRKVRKVLLLLFASTSGNTATYAARTRLALKDKLTVVMHDLAEWDEDKMMAMVKNANLVVMMISTYGSGAPPSTARKFLIWLQNSADAKQVWTGKPYMVLGFGSRAYPRFCAAADLVYAMLLSLDASPCTPVSKCDALGDEERSYVTWFTDGLTTQLVRAELLTQEAATAFRAVMLSQAPETVECAYRIVTLQGRKTGAKPKNVLAGIVSSITELLQLPPAGCATKSIVIDISHMPNVRYASGDEVAILAENPDAWVDVFASAIGITNVDEMIDVLEVTQAKGTGKQAGQDEVELQGVKPFPLPNTYQTILKRFIALADAPSFAAMRSLATFAPGDSKLVDLAGSFNKYEQWVTQECPRWLDIFSFFPSLVGRIPLEMFFQVAPTIRPRYYSISSSCNAKDGELAITVSQNTFTTPGGQLRSGFCSSYLCSRQPGQTLNFKLVAMHNFRMPYNTQVPVVLVGAGVGIAPFRGFWQERSWLVENGEELGPCILLFGCRNKHYDLLYRDELELCRSKAVISELQFAFSREPGEGKTYVQDLFIASNRALMESLQHPRAHLFICGSSSMAENVKAALKKLLGAEPAASMIREGRLKESVFGVARGTKR